MKGRLEDYIRFLEQAVLRPKEKSYLSQIIRERAMVLFFMTIRALCPFLWRRIAPAGDAHNMLHLHQQRLRNSVIIISGDFKTPGHSYRVERILASFYHLGIPGKWITPEGAADELHLLTHCKLLILWRTPFTHVIEAWIRKSESMNIPVWFDLDDYLISPELALSGNIDSARTFGASEEEVTAGMTAYLHVLRMADLATCPTLPLAEAIRREGKPAVVIPNGYTEEQFYQSDRLWKDRQNAPPEKIVRIGYAGGTLTHQQDFRTALPALVRILREFPETILTVFPDSLLMHEFPELLPFHSRIETRGKVQITELPFEINRFDINIAPLEVNPFCEAKSELKYFEAALLRIPTVATATQPFRQSIRHGYNGFLASSENDWYESLKILVTDPSSRTAMGEAAYFHVQYHFSAEQRIHLLFRILNELGLDRQFNIPFMQQRCDALKNTANPDTCYRTTHPDPPELPIFRTLFSRQSGDATESGILVVISDDVTPSGQFITHLSSMAVHSAALAIVMNRPESFRAEAIREQLVRNAGSFPCCCLLATDEKVSAGALRNLGFSHLTARYILILENDASFPGDYLRESLTRIRNTGASLVQPEQLKNSFPGCSFHAEYFDDHLSLVSKASWSKAGGFDPAGTETNLYRRFAGQGFFGLTLPEKKPATGPDKTTP